MEKDGTIASANDFTEAHHNEKLEPSSQQPELESEDEFRFTFGKLLAILSFQLGYMSDVFVLSMASAVLTSINQDIGPSTNYTWMVTAQIVGAAVLSPLIGRFGDIFGRRNFLLAGNVVSIIGCAVAASAKTVNTIIGASALIGIGSSMHQLAWSCLGEITPKRSRGFALSLFQASLAPASAFGPIIAYGFVNNGSWRPVYWFPFALNCTALVLIFFFYRPKNQYIKEEGKTRWDQIKDTDFIGCGIFVAGLVLFLLGISFGGNLFPWTSAGTIAPIVIGFCLLVVLGVYEAKATIKYPCFPRAIFRNVRGFTVIIVGIFLLGMLYYSSGVLWPQQIQALYTQNNINIGWYASALGLGGSVFGPIFGWLFMKYRNGHIQLPVILGIMTIVSGAQAIVSRTSNKGSTALQVLIGALVAGSTVVSTAMVQVGVKHEYIGVASGMAICARSVGGAVATTIYVSILQQKLKAALPGDVALPLAESGVAPPSIPAIIGTLLSGDLTSPVLAALTPTQLMTAALGLQNSFTHAFKIVYLVSIAFGVVGTLAVCFSANVNRLLNHHIDIQLEEGAHIHGHTDTGEGHILKAGMEE